jgi:hypothetical protein
MYNSSSGQGFNSNYYYNVYQEQVDAGPTTTYNLNSKPVFSLAIGTTGSTALFNTDDTLRYTYPSWAVYRQFANILLSGGSTAKFTTITDAREIGIAYIISVARDRMKDGVDKNNWELRLTGSAALTMKLIAAPATSINQTVFDVYSGSLNLSAATPTASYEANTAGTSGSYGLFYADKGIFILDAAKLHDKIQFLAHPGTAATGTYIADSSDALSAGYQPWIGLNSFFASVSGGNYFAARSTENIQATHYFVRAQNFEFNSSENPTWRSSVGLYDGDDANVPGNLVAVAKLSKPLLKSLDSEALIRIRLDFVWFLTLLPTAYSTLTTLL